MARGQDNQDLGMSWGASGRSHASRSEEEFLEGGSLVTDETTTDSVGQ